MYIEKLAENDSISVAIPLTDQTGKTRIKKRTILNEYGLPVATRNEPFSMNCYVEWQIGYDVVVSETEKLKFSKLPEKRFIGANGKEKALYELSEYVYFLFKWNIIKKHQLQQIVNDLKSIKNSNLFEENEELSIKRTHLTEKKFNNETFYFTKVEYPMLIHKFDQFEIITEIIIKEKQKAVGVQPMLYLCFPIIELKTNTPLLGRTANKKEIAEFIINKSNYSILLKLLYLFGMLSKNHKNDILSIIELILND